MTDTAAQIEAINDLRGAIKDTAEAALLLKVGNIMLAYRHLEDASMRLGKVIQALDGGVSVYDKRTTVGA